MRIQIDIPDDIANDLTKIAAKDERSRKKYLEMLIIAHAKEKKSKKA